MNRCSFRAWIPILRWPVWPLAGQCLLGQNVVVGSMRVLLAVCGSIPRGVCLDPIFVTSEFHHGQVQSYRAMRAEETRMYALLSPGKTFRRWGGVGSVSR